MSSRLKERGGAGAKVMASNPSKTLTLPYHQDKLNSQRIPFAASHKELPRLDPAARHVVPRCSHAAPVYSRKENPRPISAGRTCIARTSAPAFVSVPGKENPRPLSAVRASVTLSDKPPLMPEPAVRFSTSSLPRSRKFTDFPSDRGPQVSSFGERRSITGFRALDKESVGKGPFGKDSSGKYGKPVNVVTGVLSDRRSNGFLGAKSERSAFKVLDAKPKKAVCNPQDIEAGASVSAPYVKLVDKMERNKVMVSEINEYDVSIEVKQESGRGNNTMGSNTNGEDNAQDLQTDELKVLDNCENKEIAVDGFNNTTYIMEKYCLNPHPEGEDSTSMDLHNAQVECSNTSLSRVHHSKTVQLSLESKRDEGNIGAGVEDVCIDNKYPSKLHEKLALLEDKVQKIALEIKQTKDMLDKNKPGESRLVLSDIQKKVSGVEKAVDNIKDGAKSELFSSYSGKFRDLQGSCMGSNLREKTRNSLHSLKSLNHEQLEARFFPHNKLTRDHVLSTTSVEKDKPACSELNNNQKVDDSLIDENLIAVEFLASLTEELPKPRNLYVNMQLTHGMVNKTQLDRTSPAQCGSRSTIEGRQQDLALESNERLEEFDAVENNPPSMSCLGTTEESSVYQLSEIGWKVSTGGWFVSEGEAVLLAHDDNSCSYYDIANSEVKSEYKPPAGFPSNLWGDCWLVRAPGIDGCSGRYVVAASAGNSLESGFCSWDFYTKDIKAFQVTSSPGTAVAPMTRKSLHTSSLLESQFCWYRPCGLLLISTSSRQKTVNAYDIRDGDQVMTWEVNSVVAEMEYSSPLQWRSRGKVVIAEREAITLWDVNSLNPHPTVSVPSAGKRVHALHVNNTDAEIGAGVRQRASSSEVEGNDGAFCSQDSVNVFDFRIPSGVGLKISRHGANALSMFSIGDSILIGSTEGRLAVKGSPRSNIEHFSLRKGSIITTYRMPEFNSHYHHSSITQVWSNSNVAMGICGMGLHVFDAFNDEGLTSSLSIYEGSTEAVKETIGPDDLFRPTFDYVESRALVISRDRPAFWRYLP